MRPMSPQRSAAARRVAPTPLDVLPPAVAQHIFSLLPVDARLRAAAVCRSWRALLAERSLWTRLDLSAVRPFLSRDGILGVAAARAGGHLEVIRLPEWTWNIHHPLLKVLDANARTMRELTLLRSRGWASAPDSSDVAALLRAAPELRLLEINDVECHGAAALSVLRQDTPFEPMRLTCIAMESADLVDWSALRFGLGGHTALEVV